MFTDDAPMFPHFFPYARCDCLTGSSGFSINSYVSL